MTLAQERPLATVVAEVVRPCHLAERIVVVDGMPGCGKTLLSAIVSALDRVEVEKYVPKIEHLCVSHFLGKLTDDAARTLVTLFTDIDLYSLMISREVNFKPSDLSSVFRSPRPWRYVRRLFQPDGQPEAERIERERPILNFVTHNLLPVCDPVMHGLGERVVIVEVVRHPLYMLKQWFLYIHRYGTDVRDFTLWLAAEGASVPWFAQGWEAAYLRAPLMDRVIYSIEHLGRLAREALGRLPASQRRQVITVPFEPFVLDPWLVLQQLEAALGTRVTSVTRRELRRQRVPRARIADGLGLKVYRANGWQPPKGSGEAEELTRRRAFAAEHATAAAMDVLDRLCAEYERAYPLAARTGR